METQMIITEHARTKWKSENVFHSSIWITITSLNMDGLAVNLKMNYRQTSILSFIPLYPFIHDEWRYSISELHCCTYMLDEHVHMHIQFIYVKIEKNVEHAIAYCHCFGSFCIACRCESRKTDGKNCFPFLKFRWNAIWLNGIIFFMVWYIHMNGTIFCSVYLLFCMWMFLTISTWSKLQQSHFHVWNF